MVGLKLPDRQNSRHLLLGKAHCKADSLIGQCLILGKKQKPPVGQSPMMRFSLLMGKAQCGASCWLKFYVEQKPLFGHCPMLGASPWLAEVHVVHKLQLGKSHYGFKSAAGQSPYETKNPG